MNDTDNSVDNFFEEKDDIHTIIREYWIVIDGTYVINNDKTVDINGNIKFPESCSFLTELPLKFNKVSGDFDCSKLSLKTLEGSPLEVGGTFNCSYNELISLEFAPVKARNFIFDNAVSNLFTGRTNFFEEAAMIFRTSSSNLPIQIKENTDLEILPIIFKYQSYFDVWNEGLSFNEAGFKNLADEIQEGLE